MKKDTWLRVINFRHLALFCLLEVCFVFFMIFAWQHNCDSYLANRSSHLQTVAEAIKGRSEAVAYTIVHEVIQQSEILELQYQAVLATHHQRQAIRKELHSRLTSTYRRLQQENPLRMQLILPDGTSLLRMHKPEHWGDQLFPVREVLRLAASEKREVTGYESGRNDLGAYRFAFPLFRDNKFIGIIELSLDDTDLVEQLGRQYKHSFWLMLARHDIVLPKQFKKTAPEQQLGSKINPDYHEIWPKSEGQTTPEKADLIEKLSNRPLKNG